MAFLGLDDYNEEDQKDDQPCSEQNHWGYVFLTNELPFIWAPLFNGFSRARREISRRPTLYNFFKEIRSGCLQRIQWLLSH